MKRTDTYASVNTPIHSDRKSSRKLKSKLDIHNVMDDLKLVCLCEQQCIEKFNIGEVLAGRKFFHSKNEVGKLQWLIDVLKLFYNIDQNKVTLMLNGHVVCRDAFLVYYGISQYKYYAAKKNIQNGNLIAIHGNSLRNYKRTIEDKCFTYLQSIMEHYGDVQPDSDEVHLPCHCLKSEVFMEFLNTIKDNTLEEDTPSYRSFMRIWETSFPNLKIPKKNRLGKCDVCARLSNDKLTLTRLTLPAWQLQRRNHIQNVYKERQENNRRIVFAQTYPALVTLIGIDRMNALRMPWQMPFPKSWLTKARPRYEVISLLDFGNNQSQLYHGLNCFPHDSDMTMTILYFRIRELRESGNVTPKLILHMDNCYRENKNRYVFAFCVMLLFNGWYKEVNLFFLPPGHTHAENDALFVPIAKGKWTTNCHSPKHFVDYFTPKCYRRYKQCTIPTLKEISFVYTWRNWLSPHMRDIQHHSSHRAFQFIKKDNGIEMFYKNSTVDQNWIGYHTSYGYQLLSSFPEGYPQILLPSLLENKDLKDIPSMYDFMDETNKHWWESFISNQSAFHLSLEETRMYNDNFWLQNIHIEDPIPVNIVTETPPQIIVNSHPVVHSEIIIGEIIAVVADDSETFWIAKVISFENNENDNDIVYNIHYFQQDKNGIWKLMKENRIGSIGTTTIDAILLTKINFTKNKMLPKRTIKKIESRLQKSVL